jgi:signal transduction histidine kinase
MSTVLTSPARSRPQHDRLAHNREPRALNGLTRETQRLLHDVALHALSALGVRAPMRTIVAEEMEWQATQLTATMPPDADRDRWIRAAAVRVLNEVE